MLTQDAKLPSLSMTMPRDCVLLLDFFSSRACPGETKWAHDLSEVVLMDAPHDEDSGMTLTLPDCACE